jgi:hypothetical protein
MHAFFVRRRMLTLAALTSAVALAACGEDKRIKQLNLGITRDSAVSILSHDLKGNEPDSFPNVYARDRYLIEGKSYEVLYFTPNNEKEGRDSVPAYKLTPLLFVNNMLAAKGWDAWDSAGKVHNIQVRPHAKPK